MNNHEKNVRRPTFFQFFYPGHKETIFHFNCSGKDNKLFEAEMVVSTIEEQFSKHVK